MTHLLFVRNDKKEVVYSKVGGFAELKAIVVENIKENKLGGRKCAIISLSNPQNRYSLSEPVKKSSKKAK
jgi:hypothetical protein|tara:strand:- start:1480 stop:1689 length:210 start_codon:yes stop_codon:yes gene_type:complete